MCKLNYMIHTTLLQGKSHLRDMVMNAKDATRRAKLIAFVFDMRVKVARSLFLSVKRVHRIQESFIFRVLGIHVPVSGRAGLSAILKHANRIEVVINNCGVSYLSYKDDLWYFLNLTSFIFPSGEAGRTRYDVMETTKAFSIAWLLKNTHNMLPEKHRRFASKLIGQVVSSRGLRGGSKRIDISESVSDSCHDRSSIIVLLYSVQRELACKLRRNSNIFQKEVLHIMQSTQPVWMRRKGGMKRSNYSLAYHCELFKNLIYLRREATPQTIEANTKQNDNTKSKAEFALQQDVSDNLVGYISETLPQSLYRLHNSTNFSEELRMCRLHKQFERVSAHNWSRSCVIQEKKRIQFALNIIEGRASPKQDNIFNAMRSLYATDWFASMLLRKIRRGRHSEIQTPSLSHQSDREVDRNLLMIYSKDSGSPQVQCMAYNYATGRRCKYNSAPCSYNKGSNEKASCLQFCELHSDYTLLTGLCIVSGKLVHILNLAVAPHENKQVPLVNNNEAASKADAKEEDRTSAVNIEVLNTVGQQQQQQQQQQRVAEKPGAKDAAGGEECNSTLATIKEDDDGTEMTKAYMLRIVCSKNYVLSLALLRLLVHDDVPTYVIKTEIVLPIAKPEINPGTLLSYVEDFKFQRRYQKMSAAFATATASDSNSKASDILRSVISIAGTPTSLYSLRMYPNYKKSESARLVVLENGRIIKNILLSGITTKITQVIDNNTGIKKQLNMQDILHNAMNTSA